MRAAIDSADLFRHVSAEKAAFYRAIMDVFAAAKGNTVCSCALTKYLQKPSGPKACRVLKRSTWLWRS